MMRRPQGYATWSSPDGVVECDTMTCAHCNSIRHVKPKERAEDLGGLCRVCMGLICKHCVGKSCVPFMEKVDRLEKALRRNQEVGRWWECN